MNICSVAKKDTYCLGMPVRFLYAGLMTPMCCLPLLLRLRRRMIATKGQIWRRLREHTPVSRDRLWGNAALFGRATPYMDAGRGCLVLWAGLPHNLTLTLTFR